MFSICTLDQDQYQDHNLLDDKYMYVYNQTFKRIFVFNFFYENKMKFNFIASSCICQKEDESYTYDFKICSHQMLIFLIENDGYIILGFLINCQGCGYPLLTLNGLIGLQWWSFCNHKI